MSNDASPAKVLARERERQAMSLRVGGASYQAIADRLGVSKAGAYKIVARALASVKGETRESASEMVEIERQRLDRMQAALWPDALRGDSKAIDRILSIMGRRARLFGLDEPDRSEVVINDTDPRQLLSDRLADLMQRRGASDPDREPDR